MPKFFVSTVDGQIFVWTIFKILIMNRKIDVINLVCTIVTKKYLKYCTCIMKVK